MQTIKQTLFTGWHFMRWFRLVFGLLFTIEVLRTHDLMIGLVAAFFLFTAIFNTGCCGSGTCAVPGNKRENEKT